MIQWRRYRSRGLIRLWDKWWRWARRLAREIAAQLRRHPDRRPAHVTVDEAAPREVRNG